ncbi:MAG TPA: GNAT family protein [Anaerolineae bacterium]
MSLTFIPMDEASARAVTQWQYEAPYNVYNVAPDEDIEEVVAYLLDPQNGFYALRGVLDNGSQEELLAYCSFGLDAQVAGGDYSRNALDIGLGLRPDLTGQGRGLTFVEAILDFARQAFTPAAFRVTIAAFNERAQRVWQRAGFRQTHTFHRQHDGQPFVILIQDA